MYKQLICSCMTEEKDESLLRYSRLSNTAKSAGKKQAEGATKTTNAYENACDLIPRAKVKEKENGEQTYAGLDKGSRESLEGLVRKRK